MIHIMNLKFSQEIQQYDVQVVDSILRNPFPFSNEHGRKRAIQKYECHFFEQIKVCSKFQNEVRRLLHLYVEHNQLRLFCWCAPRECHAEVIRNCLYDPLYTRFLMKGENS